MSGPSDRRFDLNLVEEAAPPSPDNIWRPSFEIRGLKHENKQLHRLAHDYATNMKRKLDQMKESDGQVLLDHQRFVGLFQRHLLPSSSRAVPRNEALNDQPLMPHPSRVLSSTEAPNDPPPLPSLSGALPTAETSPKQPL
ncbi:unnamed protein product [Malus baccata var. baccata]